MRHFSPLDQYHGRIDCQLKNKNQRQGIGTDEWRITLGRTRRPLQWPALSRRTRATNRSTTSLCLTFFMCVCARTHVPSFFSLSTHPALSPPTPLSLLPLAFSFCLALPPLRTPHGFSHSSLSCACIHLRHATYAASVCTRVYVSNLMRPHPSV